MILIIIFEMT